MPGATAVGSAVREDWRLVRNGENNADDSALRKAWLLFEEEVGTRHPETWILSADSARTLLCTHRAFVYCFDLSRFFTL